jgi:3-dehydrosphinganine reductase
VKPRGDDGLCIVSGASSGIGLEVARQLIERGATVLAIARDPTRLRAAREGLGAAGDRYRPEPLDVRDAAAVEAACADAIARHGAPRWVVASAGIARPGCFLELPAEEHARAIGTNYLGTVHLARACLPAMARSGEGRFVLVSSAAALGTFYGFSAYSPSKAALRALADILALELAQHGVQVTIAFPPDTDTPQLRAELPQRPPLTRRYLAGNKPLGAAQVAAAILAGAAAGRRELAIGAGPRWLLSWPSLSNAIGRYRQRQLLLRATGPGATSC